MSESPRLRRHTDGRVAVSLVPDWWTVTSDGPGSCVLADIDVSGDGWTELFVAELPEPDADGAWPLPADGGVITVTAEGIALNGMPWPGDIGHLRGEAMSMLAAVAACERYRAEREAMS